METLLKEVRRALRRLFAAELARSLALALFWAGWVIGAALLARRWTGPPPAAAWAGFAAAVALAAFIRAWLRRPSLRTAALALDGAAGLEERLSAALSVGADESPAARALLRDAEEAVHRADSRSVPVPLPRLRPLALPAAFALAALLWPMARGAAGPDADRPPDTSAPVPEPVRKEESARLRRRAFNLEKLARDVDRPELKDLAEQMRRVSEELRKEETSKNEALAKISSLEEKARQAMEQLAMKYPQNLMKRIRETGQSGAKEGEHRGTDPGKKAADLARAVASLREKLARESPTAQDRQALESLADELKDAFGDDAPFKDLQQKLEELLKNGADPNDLQTLKDALAAIEGDLEDLELLDILSDELVELFASKDDLAEEGGT